MNNIMPISDLRNNFAEISKRVNENNEVIIFTKNGYGNMVVMSIDEYQRLTFEHEIITKLKESEEEFKKNPTLYSGEEVFKELRAIAKNQGK